MAEHDTHDDSPPRWRAAQYVRMSTEHQQYSTENQRDMIRDYAAKRGIEIVRTYADDGKSGLRIDGRLALQQLIREVEAGRVDFQIILVYDVSRWGRFQDAGAYGRDHAGRAALAEESKPKKPPTGTADALARLQPEMEQVQ